MWKSTVVQLNHVYSWQQCEPKFRSASCQAIERFGSFVFYPIFGDGRNKKWSKHISYNVLQILWQFRGKKNKWCSIRNVTVYINLDATTEIEWNVAKERVFYSFQHRTTKTNCYGSHKVPEIRVYIHDSTLIAYPVDVNQMIKRAYNIQFIVSTYGTLWNIG